jgi:hypothetical protein
MKFKLFAGIGLLASLAAPLNAQSPLGAIVATPTTATQVAVIAPSKDDNILRAGTEVPLITREELTTKKKQLRVGQRFQMEVSANIERGGVIVIPAGTPAIGEITEVRNKGMWGKSGYINARIVSLRLGDRNVRLSGTFDDKGVTGTGGVVAAVALIPVAGFFTTGTSAMIASGSPVKGFMDEDLMFQAVQVAPRVLQVPAAPSSTASASSIASVIPASVVTN